MSEATSINKDYVKSRWPDAISIKIQPSNYVVTRMQHDNCIITLGAGTSRSAAWKNAATKMRLRVSNA